MLISKKSLSYVGNIDKNLIDWVLQNNVILADINRELNLDDSDNRIDDITPSEIELGTKIVKDYCIKNNLLQQLSAYYNIVLKGEQLLNSMKEIKLDEINQSYGKAIDAIQKEYIPVTEMLTFETQERESLEYKKNGYSDDNVCPTMKAISISRGMNLKDLCDKAILKATLYRQAIGGLIGKRQGLQDKIEQVKTLEELESIVWSD
ncbi:hypothetical protein ACD574_02185 [Campylobacter sp. LH-2024]|uniref:hypothetical protein n=2 Tax=Campylobacter sp. LH-2024 TaxID=3239825 RepID=UPI003B81A15D